MVNTFFLFFEIKITRETEPKANNGARNMR
jgi:hypothetical protein